MMWRKVETGPEPLPRLQTSDRGQTLDAASPALRFQTRRGRFRCIALGLIMTHTIRLFIRVPLNEGAALAHYTYMPDPNTNSGEHE
jgi:hypothetical protein